MAVWINNRQKDETAVENMVNYFKKYNIELSKPLACAILNRGFVTTGSAAMYIGRDFGYINKTGLNGLKDVDKAVEIIASAISNGKKIWIYGDYDVDGVMSTTILYKSFKALGGNVNYYIPDRVKDGYGLNKNSIEDIIDKGCDLLVTCDNGIAAKTEIDFANDNNIPTIVLDHHEPPIIDGKEVIPNAAAVVDAKQSASEYKFKEMCAGSLCYRFVKQLYSYMNRKLENEAELITFAAIATVCDVVPLVEDNRIIAYWGLKAVNKKINNLGLAELVELTGITRNGRKINETDFGFIIGPCINAVGRLENATSAVALFTTDDREKAKKTAERMVWLNSERKKMTEEGTKKITDEIESKPLDKVIVEYNGEIHESIAGIIAGRIKEKYNRPTVILTNGNGMAKGSGRSIEGYDLFEELSKCRELLDRFGGHTMAAGLSLLEENIDELREMLNTECDLRDGDLVKKYKYDAVVDLRDMTLKCAEDMNIMQPFGTANTKPIFAAMDVKLSGMRIMGAEGNVVAFTAGKKGASVRCIAFGAEMVRIVSNAFDSDTVIVGDILFSLSVNEYMGNKSVQLQLIDLRK